MIIKHCYRNYIVIKIYVYIPAQYRKVVQYCYKAFQVKQVSLDEYLKAMISMDIHASAGTSLQ